MLGSVARWRPAGLDYRLTVDEPRLARRNEFGEAMAFTDRIFRANFKGRQVVAGNYPHLYSSDKHKRLLLVRDRGQLVGCLGMHPMLHHAEEVSVNAGGLGIVGTHPERRREGIMAAMLNNAISRMQQTGYSVSVLVGDRQRYNWFGWEYAGLRHLFTLDLRHLGRPSAIERKLELRRLQDNHSLHRKLLASSPKRPYRVERSGRDIASLFIRTSRHTWTCQDGRLFAYVCLRGPNHNATPYVQLDEAGGNRDLVLSMLRVLMTRNQVESLEAITGPNPDEIDLFHHHSSEWHSRNDQMIKILDFPRLLRELQPLLKRRAKAAGILGNFRFEMRTSGQMGELRLGNGRRYVVRLSDCDMVSLFFGNLQLGKSLARIDGRDPSYSATARNALTRILPVTLYNPPVSHC